jgi:GAF domain-containing protein
MAEQDEIVAEVVRELSGIRGLAPSVEKVTEAARLLFGADQAGVTLIRGGGRLESAGETAPVVVELDALQYDLRQGPCVEAATEQHLVVASNLEKDSRWPTWGPAAHAKGIHSMMAADLHADGSRFGALNLYGERVGQFDEVDGELVKTFTTHAAAALESARKIESLSTALETRTIIGQAEGIVMERFRVDGVTAFAILKRCSQDSNTRLREIAQQIVDTRNLP